MVFATENLKIGVIGLGYVGLPVAIEFAKQYPTIGFDTNLVRVDELGSGIDATREVSPRDLIAAESIRFSGRSDEIADCNFYVVTVPTPIGESNRPILTALREASETLGNVIKRGDVVVYESTVFPGATEEFCVPILEGVSKLRFNEDFFVGYSPERINPSDKEHRLRNICKVTSGSTPEVAEFIDRVYASVIAAGTHKASSIKVAEAAKVIENTQRDVNIALINELAMIFERIGIDTEEVLEAAGTKWNFLPFRPGLVGGHCIGVDPYYLAYKAQQLGYHPQMILAGRGVNDNMPLYVAAQVIKCMLRKGIQPLDASVLVLGLAFKENCPDARNSKVFELVGELETYGAKVDVHDPWVDPDAARAAYGLELVANPAEGAYDVIVIAVAHDEFRKLGEDGIKAFTKPTSVIYDVKYVLSKDATDDRL